MPQEGYLTDEDRETEDSFECDEEILEDFYQEEDEFREEILNLWRDGAEDIRHELQVHQSIELLEKALEARAELKRQRAHYNELSRTAAGPRDFLKRKQRREAANAAGVSLPGINAVGVFGNFLSASLLAEKTSRKKQGRAQSHKKDQELSQIPPYHEVTNKEEGGKGSSMNVPDTNKVYGKVGSGHYIDEADGPLPRNPHDTNDQRGCGEPANSLSPVSVRSSNSANTRSTSPAGGPTTCKSSRSPTRSPSSLAEHLRLNTNSMSMVRSASKRANGGKVCQSAEGDGVRKALLPGNSSRPLSVPLEETVASTAPLGPLRIRSANSQAPRYVYAGEKQWTHWHSWREGVTPLSASTEGTAADESKTRTESQTQRSMSAACVSLSNALPPPPPPRPVSATWRLKTPPLGTTPHARAHGVPATLGEDPQHEPNSLVVTSAFSTPRREGNRSVSPPSCEEVHVSTAVGDCLFTPLLVTGGTFSDAFFNFAGGSPKALRMAIEAQRTVASRCANIVDHDPVGQRASSRGCVVRSGSSRSRPLSSSSTSSLISRRLGVLDGGVDKGGLMRAVSHLVPSSSSLSPSVLVGKRCASAASVASKIISESGMDPMRWSTAESRAVREQLDAHSFALFEERMPKSCANLRRSAEVYENGPRTIRRYVPPSGYGATTAVAVGNAKGRTPSRQATSSGGRESSHGRNSDSEWGKTAALPPRPLSSLSSGNRQNEI